MQGGLAHLAASDPHLLHHGEGRDAAGAPHADHDVEQFGVDLFRRVFVRDRPARGTAGRAQFFVQGQLIDLHDDAVDLVLNTAAMLAEIADELGRF